MKMRLVPFVLYCSDACVFVIAEDLSMTEILMGRRQKGLGTRLG